MNTNISSRITLGIEETTALLEVMIKQNVKLQKENSDAELNVPMLLGPPGIGKSALIKKVAQNLGYKLNVLIPQEFVGSEMMGWRIAEAGADRMRHITPDWLAKLQDISQAEPDKPAILFIDELPQAMPAVQNLVARLVREGVLGEKKLPDNWVVVCAGNETGQRANVNEMPTQLTSRMTLLYYKPSIEETIDLFIKLGTDHRVVNFLRSKTNNSDANEPIDGSKFFPYHVHVDAIEDCFPTLRNWQKVSTHIKDREDLYSYDIAAIAGSVGQFAAMAFKEYLVVYDKLPEYEDVVNRPSKAKVNTKDPNVLWALCGWLGSRVGYDEVDAVVNYVENLGNPQLFQYFMSHLIESRNEIKQGEKRPVRHHPTVMRFGGSQQELQQDDE